MYNHGLLHKLNCKHYNDMIDNINLFLIFCNNDIGNGKLLTSNNIFVRFKYVSRLLQSYYEEFRNVNIKVLFILYTILPG